MTWAATFASVVLLAAASASIRAADAPPLTLEARIPLGSVSGRIDHLAFDPARERLYVAELGNNAIGIVDVKTRRLVRTLPGFAEPQGIAYEPASDALYIANGGDGSLRILNASDFTSLGEIPLGADADNVRIDRTAHRVYVGYGNGALAVIDSLTRKRLADIPLKGHPESFQLDAAGDRIFVNVPDATQIAVVSRESGQQVAAWSTGNWRANYPLTLDPDKGRVIAAFRRPARMQSFELRTGRVLGGIDTCGDSDDVFVDAQRRRVYVICGEGFVDSLDSSGDAYTSIGRLRTSAGSRTGLFVPETDRLFVAIRATQDQGAAIWILRPGP